MIRTAALKLKKSLFFLTITLSISFLNGDLCKSAEPSSECLKSRSTFKIDGTKTYSEYLADLNRKNCLKPWTVLIYMAAENDLAPYALLDLYEMEAGFQSGKNLAGSTSRSDILVQIRTGANEETRRIHVFQSPETYDKSLRKEDFENRSIHQVRSPIVERLSDLRESESQKLQNFLEWGIQNYPSEHYMVIVWGHGQGWTSVKSSYRSSTKKSRYLEEQDLPQLGSTRKYGGLAFNHRTGDFIDIPSLSKVLMRVSRGILKGHTIDLYASDACLMQMLEVASEITDSTRFIVGSAQVQEFLGLPYRRIFYEINSGRFTGEKQTATALALDEAHALARAIPEIFKASFSRGGLQGKLAPEAIRSITMSSLSSPEITRYLLPSLDNFSIGMLNYLAEDPLRALDVQFILKNAPSYDGGAQELASVLSMTETLLIAEAERTKVWTKASLALRRTITQAKADLNSSVMRFTLGTDYLADQNSLYLLGFKAVSVWIPQSQEEYRSRIKDFSRSRFYKSVPHWEKWLTQLYTSSMK